MKGMRAGLVVVVIAVAAMSMMAFGAGSAAATTICATNTSPCGSPYAAHAQFEVVGTANFESSSSGFSCGFAYTFEIGTNNRPTVQARVLSWTFGNCTNSHAVSSLSLPSWPLLLTTTGSGPNGTGEMQPTFAEPFEIDGCAYEQSAIPLMIEGGGWFTTSGVSLTRTTGTCPVSFTMAIPSSKPIPMLWMR